MCGYKFLTKEGAFLWGQIANYTVNSNIGSEFLSKGWNKLSDGKFEGYMTKAVDKINSFILDNVFDFSKSTRAGFMISIQDMDYISTHDFSVIGWDSLDRIVDYLKLLDDVRTNPHYNDTNTWDGTIKPLHRAFFDCVENFVVVIERKAAGKSAALVDYFWRISRQGGIELPRPMAARSNTDTLKLNELYPNLSNLIQELPRWDDREKPVQYVEDLKKYIDRMGTVLQDKDANAEEKLKACDNFFDTLFSLKDSVKDVGSIDWQGRIDSVLGRAIDRCFTLAQDQCFVNFLTNKPTNVFEAFDLSRPSVGPIDYDRFQPGTRQGTSWSDEFRIESSPRRTEGGGPPISSSHPGPDKGKK